MATRLYFRHDTPKALPDYTGWAGRYVTPPFFGGLATTKAPSDIASALTAITTVSGNDYLWGGFVSAPLAAGAVSGTVKGQALCQESTTSANYVAQVKVHLLDGTTGAIKATLYGGETSAAYTTAEFGTTLTNRAFPYLGAGTLTEQTAAAGDRLLVTVGLRAFVASNAYTGLMQLNNGNTLTDLPEDTTSTSGTPWVEFSQDLTFLTDTLVFPEKVADFLDDFEWKMNRVHDMRIANGEEPRSGSSDGGEETGGSGPVRYQIWPRGKQ